MRVLVLYNLAKGIICYSKNIIAAFHFMSDWHGVTMVTDSLTYKEVPGSSYTCRTVFMSVAEN